MSNAQDSWTCPLSRHWAKFEKESHMFLRSTAAKRELEKYGNIERRHEIAGRKVQLVAHVGGAGIARFTATWSPDKPNVLDSADDQKYAEARFAIETDVTLACRGNTFVVES